ncbi:MAG: AsmA family protein [Acidobacteriia bacterium]|nr:AsmA family protein [Terriglobia bacterium]
MRKLGIILGIVAAIIVLAAVAVWALFDVNRYRGRIQAELEQRTGRAVTLGNMNLGLLPPRFHAENLRIGEDPKFGGSQPFVHAERLDVSVHLLPLLSGHFEIDSLDLQQPQVELVKNSQGVWNFSSLGSSPSQVSSPGSAGAQTPSGDSTPSFSLGQLAVHGGQVALTDLQKGEARTVYDHIDLTLRNYASGKPFSIEVAAHLPGKGAQELKLQGELGPLSEGDPAGTPFHGTLNLKEVGIAGLQKFLGIGALSNADGMLSATAKLDSTSGKVSVAGDLKAEKMRVHGQDIDYPILATYEITDDLKGDLISIERTTIQLGPTPFSISGTVNTRPTPVHLDLILKAGNVSILEVARLASSFGVAFSRDTTVNGRTSADLRAQGPANNPTVTGTLTGQGLVITGKAVPQPVGVRSVELTLTPTEIRSNSFDATSGKTTVNVRFVLQNYASKSPTLDAALRAPSATLPEFLSILKACGVTGLDKISGSGTIDADLNASGPLESVASTEILKKLNGNVRLNFTTVRVAGTDVGYQLASIGGFLKSAQKDQGATNISRLTGNIQIKNGIAQTNDLQALLDIGNIGATGTANLATETLDLRMNAVLSKVFSQTVGGTSISGYMNTVLANSVGELVIPAIVTGTFQNPKYAPDLKRMAQMKLKGLLPSSDNPSAGISTLLGGLLGKKEANKDQQPGQNATPANTLDQLLRGLIPEKKKPQPPPK